MNLLITGGSGFIGRNLLESLNAKYNIRAPRHSELDLTDEKSVREFFNRNHIDVVIHTAYKPGHRNAVDCSNLFCANTRMFYNLLDSREQFGKLINLGSGAVYDMREYQPKMSEEYFGVNIPNDEHGFCKYVCYQQMKHLGNVVDLRVFGIFGKYEDYAIRFISNAICKALFDLPITIRQNRCFDYLYINDLTQVIEYFINNEGQYKAYNVTPDNSIQLLDLAKIVRRISGRNVPIQVAEEGMGMEYSGDNTRLKGEIPGMRYTPLDEAITALYQWYSDNISLLNRECLLFDK